MKDVIKAPIITEKSASISADGSKIVLKVAKDANKVQIRQAVEKAFDVKDMPITHWGNHKMAFMLVKLKDLKIVIDRK